MTPSIVSATEIKPQEQQALRLDDLLALDAGRLHRLYCEAKVPSLQSLSGDLRGRVLTPVVLSPAWNALMVTWGGTNWFPWRGKSFSPVSESDGRGINRVFGARMYPFETFVGPSRAGDFDAVQLNYDLPENPIFLRPTKDEIRELSPGLFLGQAYVALRKGDKFVLYFALTSIQ